ncbi:MAG: DUF4442 domain-containing protein [Gemmatimonadota bacterium]|nr:DUF4442 domain-containing protein [Gemmatimonadota bacterium]
MTLESPSRPESWSSRLLRWKFNLFPAYRGTGARITHLSADEREVHVELPLSWRTRNYVGTIYGGSMYAAVDPIWMVLLIRALGDDYVVWNRSGSIEFLRPGRSTLHARFLLEDSELDSIRSALENERSVERSFSTDLVDEGGEVHAVVEITLHIRRKETRG